MSAEDLFSRYKEKFDLELARELESQTTRLFERLGEGACFENIVQATNVALAGGKRARPFLLQTMYENLGGQDQELITRAAVATEIFHVFCLIHDDVIDRAATRHGVATVHALATARHQKTNVLEAQHNGNAQAILVGDLMFSWAYSLVAQIPEGLGVFQDMINDVVAGQMLDTDFMVRGLVTAEEVERKTELKTASYTFVRPLQLGAVLAGAGPEVLKFCEDFGSAVGRAFQMQDDLLDVISESEVLGKPVMNDVREGQQTAITTHFFTHGSPADQAVFLERFGKDFTQHEESLVRDLLNRAGSIDFSKRMIEELFREAQVLLKSAPLPKPAIESLTAFTNYLAARSM
jgi:geranylgeranyl diphosphate synthase type I